MSTQQENLTSILKTSNSITNSLVKSEEELSSSAITINLGYSFCKNEHFEQCLKSRVFKANSPQTESKISTFGDLINAASYLSTSKEELDEELTDNSDSLEICDEKYLIDIEPTVLKQEQLIESNDFGVNYNNNNKFSAIIETDINTKKINAKKRFSDFLKSFCVLCDICDDKNTQRVIKLNRQEKIVAAVILMKISKTGLKTKNIFPKRIPEQSCGRCFTKIILLHHRHKIGSQKHKQIKTEQVMDQSSHGYHCQCLTCQNQYGALPVLLKGIEEQNKMQDSPVPIDFQPEHNVDVLSQGQISIGMQQPINIPSCQSQAPINFQQFSVKYEADCKSFQPQLHDHFQPLQSNTQSYSQFQMPQVQMEVDFATLGKTELCLDQTRDDFNEEKLNIVGQNQFDGSFQGHSEYYDSEKNVGNMQTLIENTSYTQEDELPTLLKELEDKCQTDMANQPSTSSGIQGRTHVTDEKQLLKKVLTCEHCNKIFTHKGDFNKHLRKHTKEKPYKCSFCDKMFSHTSNLHRHQRIHSGDRPFKCQHCDKCFNRKDKLESHKNSKFCKNRRSWK